MKRRKYLADFIQDKETDLFNRYTDSQEKVPTALNIIEPFTNSTPATQFRTLQGAEQEDIPVVRIHFSWIEEVKASEVGSSDDACILVSGLNEYFYENRKTLFAEHVDEDLMQLRAGSLEPFAHVEGTRIGKPSLSIKSKNRVQRLELWAPKKDDIGTKKGDIQGLVVWW